MALLGRIRQYGVLMMVLIVIAVFGFLFMDVSSVGRGFGGPSNVLGSVNGIDITRTDLESYVNDYKGMGAKDDEQTRAFAWSEIVKDMTFKSLSNKLGMIISDKEMTDMFVGDNLSPIVVNAFGGQADRAMIEQNRNQYLQIARKSFSQMNQNERVLVESWKNLEKKAAMERVSSKYISMLSNSNYTPTWMANAEYTRNSRNYDFNYVRVLYSDVPNTEVKVSDDDMKAYIKENAK
jgi:peptidyl-prolyl cis-trans isomerase D